MSQTYSRSTTCGGPLPRVYILHVFTFVLSTQFFFISSIFWLSYRTIFSAFELLVVFSQSIKLIHMTSHTNMNLSPCEIDYSDPPLPVPPPTDNINRDYLFQLANEMDCKDLPAPPPPSPEYRIARICQPIDELLMLSKSDTAEYKQRSYSTLEAGLNKNVALAQQSGSRNSPLHQVSSQIDVDACGEKTPFPDRSGQRESSTRLGSFNNRRFILADLPGRERSSSASSSQGISKPASHPTLPAFNMAYLHSTIHGIPITSRAGTPSKLLSPSQTSPEPSLSGLQISSPIISEQPTSPTLFAFPRPITPHTTSQPRSGSFSTQCSEPLHIDDLVSCFSDSEDEGRDSKRSSPLRKGSLEKGESRGRSRRFRRRFSGRFAFLSCGGE